MPKVWAKKMHNSPSSLVFARPLLHIRLYHTFPHVSILSGLLPVSSRILFDVINPSHYWFSFDTRQRHHNTYRPLARILSCHGSKPSPFYFHPSSYLCTANFISFEHGFLSPSLIEQHGNTRKKTGKPAIFTWVPKKHLRMFATRLTISLHKLNIGIKQRLNLFWY